MIRPLFVLATDSVIQDVSTNQVSVINLIERITPPSFPSVVPRLTFFAIFERDEDSRDLDTEAKIHILLDRKRIFSDNLNVHFSKGSKLNRNIVQFQGFLLPAPGPLQVQVTIERRSVKSYEIPVVAPPNRPETNDLPRKPRKTPSRTAKTSKSRAAAKKPVKSRKQRSARR